MNYFTQALREFTKGRTLQSSLLGTLEFPLLGENLDIPHLSFKAIWLQLCISQDYPRLPKHNNASKCTALYWGSSIPILTLPGHVFPPLSLIHVIWMLFPPLHLRSLCKSLMNLSSVLDIHSLIHLFNSNLYLMSTYYVLIIVLVAPQKFSAW